MSLIALHALRQSSNLNAIHEKTEKNIKWKLLGLSWKLKSPKKKNIKNSLKKGNYLRNYSYCYVEHIRQEKTIENKGKN